MILQTFKPELSKQQILSRLVQIREYLKQSYTMLSTLQDSNDLTNYASQMNKLHSLIEHLKEQEKGYMDLLRSLSKFQSINGNLTTFQAGSTNLDTTHTPKQYQRDILDLSELNESVTNQQKQNNSEMTYLSNALANAANLSGNKSIAVQTTQEMIQKDYNSYSGQSKNH